VIDVANSVKVEVVWSDRSTVRHTAAALLPAVEKTAACGR
jgi:hypothetical protein